MSTETEAVQEEAPKTDVMDHKLQQAQQERANFEKRSQSLESENTQHLQEIENLRSQLENTPKQEEGTLDAYEQVAKTKEDMAAIQNARLNDQAQIADLKASISKINQETDYKNQLKGLDTKYGAEHRNAAIAEVTKLCKDNGYTLQGSDHPAYDTVMIEMEKAYMRAHYEGKLKPESAQKPQTDTGLGGSNYNVLDDGIQSGSLDEVAELVRKMRQRQ